MIKTYIIDVIHFLLGKRNSWRLGRSLYIKARQEVDNSMKINGEQIIQRQLVNKVIEKYQKPVILDIGANVGEWTLFLLDEFLRRNNDSFEIHAFEPLPNTYDVLTNKISNHPLKKNVRTILKALSSEEGKATMFVVSDCAGTNSLHSNSFDNYSAQVIIDKITVEAYCNLVSIKQIHFMKCDTEGHDMEVLIGAKVLFEEERVLTCQFEYNFRWIYSGHFIKDVFDLLEKKPYRIGKITPLGVLIHEEWHPELDRFFEGNYIIIHHDAMEWFVYKIGRFDKYGIFKTD